MHRLLIALTVCSVGCASSRPPPPSIGHPPLVAVQFHSDKREAVLERRWEGMPWATACRSPCNVRVRPDFEYRVGGENIVPSRPFYLQGPTTITAHAGYRDMHRLGVVMVSIGIPLTVIGTILTLAGLKAESEPGGGYGGPPATAAGIGAGIGALFTVGGIVALATSSTTVDLRERSAIAKFTLRF